MSNAHLWRRCCCVGTALTALVVGWTACAYAAADGSRTRPVHQIVLRDENGDKITPADTWAMPFSARQTCGGCHDYDTISLGWHFNSHDPSVPAGKAGEPWVWVDEKTGTALPISERPWKGAWKPEDLGLTAWDMTKMFGRHMPGGNWGEVNEETPDPDARWNISGHLEINCLGCHNAAPEQNGSDWVIQVARENYRWAATSAAGLGVVNGLASVLPRSWDIVDGPNPDNPYAVPPHVDYNAWRFDFKTRVCLDVRSKVDPNRCYFCHTTAQVGQETKDCDQDVHIAAGLTCTDCHRNGIAHDVSRNYETKDAPLPEVGTLSCRGCHYGLPEAGADVVAKGGRLGAPRPAHKGIPETHLESLTCTACHSGLWPATDLGQVRKARANRLGVHGKADWSTKLPEIVSPVFLEDENGRLAPHHMFWPAFWARLQGDKVVPLAPEIVSKAAGNVLEPAWQVIRVLTAMKPKEDTAAVPVYLVNGKRYAQDGAATLVSSDCEAAGATGGWALLRGDRIDPVIVDSSTWTAEGLLAPKEALTPAQITGVLEGIAYQNAATGEPVYVADGKLYHLVDAALTVADPPADQSAGPIWADLSEGKLTPFGEDVMKPVVDELLSAEKTRTDERIAAILDALTAVVGTDGVPVYISNGKLFRRTAEGVEAVDAPAGAPDLPVFWGLLADEKIVSLVPDYVTEAIAAQDITKQQVLLVLKALAAEGTEGEPAYVGGGQLHRLNGDELVASSNPAAEPYSWSFAHDVRPAAQSLGSGGCTDCHAPNAPFFYAKVAPTTPAEIQTASVVPMLDIEKYAPDQVAGWEKSVKLRPLTVYGGVLAAALIGVALLRYAFMAMEAILRALVSKGGKKS